MADDARNGEQARRLNAIKTWARLLAPCIAIAFTCVSCMVGPDYQRPEEHLPTTFKSPASQPTTRAITQDWWLLFNDPTLTRLEVQALAANPGIDSALYRVEESRAAAKQVRADLFPTITFDPSIERARSASGRETAGTGTVLGGSGTGTTGSASGTGSTSGSTVTTSGTALQSGQTATVTRIPFDLSYEVDAWGRVRRSYEAAIATAQASVADYQVVLQTLEADVATDYFSVRALIDQERILKDTTESYRRQLGLVQSQLKAGLVSQTDLAQAQAQLDATITQEIDVERQIIDLDHAIAILLGEAPADFALETTRLSDEPPVVPAGLTAEILRRRPDVAEAEENLISANAAIGEAKALFYPQITLTADAGFESLDVSHALDWENRIWSIGAGLSQPLFEGGRLIANLEQTKARYNELNATYRTTVLGAIRDVEDSLTDLHYRADEAAAQQRAVDTSREYVRLSELQYNQGLASYLLVIDADRTLLSNELSASQILNQRMTSTILLIKALGGGWSMDPAPATTQP